MAIGFGSSLEEIQEEPSYDAWKDGFNKGILAAMKVISQSPLIYDGCLTEELYQEVRKLMKD